MPYIIDNEERFDGLSQNLKEKINSLLYFYNDFVARINNNTKQNIRFNDYYDMNSSVLKNIEYFKVFYNDDITLIHYIKYIVDRLLKDLFCVLEYKEFGINELLEIIDDKNVFDEATVAINYALDLLNKEYDNKSEMEFLNENNKYKIMFTKMANQDIKNLPKHILSSFVRKLNNPLSTENIIKLTECLGHTNDTYNTNYFRIQFADDYRIAYFRERNVTVILGVTIKSGHNSDYTRYDVCAKKNEHILKQINDFINDVYTNEHLDTIEFLKKFFNKKNMKL